MSEKELRKRIDVHPGEKRGECDVILVGALARILAFTQQKTNAASGGDGGTFLMVVGAGLVQERTNQTLVRVV